jgi:DNA anti-recombination protein RmuC
MRKIIVPIQVLEGTVLSKQGDGHVLLYSKDGDYYYSVSISDLQALQNEKVRKMREEFETLRKQNEDSLRALKEFEEKIDDKMDKLIANYKESMKKVFEMIGAVEEDNTDD